MNKLDSATCDRLQQRLQKAEISVRSALKNSNGDSTLRAAAEELINAHRDVRDLLQSVENDGHANSSNIGEHEVAKAEIEIRREEHELKPDAKDVIKAIFMWKDDPQERVSG